jgi:alkylation response protein AidB-like acyl-CoA dehydrogenase
MDFEYHYSSTQEEFRKEVAAFLDANLPPDWPRPHFSGDNAHIGKDTLQWAKQMRRKMGEKGWLFPTWPKEYGGGGLPPEYDVVIQEEIAKRRMPGLQPSELMPAAVLVWGTEEQKQNLARPVLEGRSDLYQLFTEPGSGSDLASLKTRAVRDGDDWLITGEKVFVGSPHGYRLRPEDEVPDIRDEVDEMFTLAITDPQAPRHRNMGYFIVPAKLPGITFQKLDLLADWGKLQIYLDNVRVPNDRLIGAAGQGWQVAQTTLELEHGGGGNVVPRDFAADRLLEYARETGKLKDPHALHAVMDAHIDAEIGRLIGVRNYWMYESKQEMSYHGSQNSLWRKESALRIADNIREVVGPECLIDDHDPKARWWGELEHHQRDSLVRAHPGGTIEVQRVIMARRLGVSRTKERAATTPSTATKVK